MKYILALTLSLTGCVSIGHHQSRIEEERSKARQWVNSVDIEARKEIERIEKKLKDCNESRSFWMDRATEK